jgi:hypothetical protein
MFSTIIPQPLRHQGKKVAAEIDSTDVRQYTACRVTIALLWLHVKFDNGTTKCLSLEVVSTVGVVEYLTVEDRS